MNYFHDLYKEQTRVILWLPVFFMGGILSYFSLQSEPRFLYLTLPFIFLSLFFILFFQHLIIRMIVLCFLFFNLGIIVIFLKAHYLNTPMLSSIMKDKPVQGVISDLEYNPEKKNYKITITLDQKTDLKLKKVKVTYTDNEEIHPKVADYIYGIATLLPFSDPVSLMSYNFKQTAYFNEIGASGRLKKITRHTPNKQTFLKKTRENLTSFLRSKLKGQSAEVSAALITGVKNGISHQIRQDFADSGLAHILAISGLHISLIAGIVFMFFRRPLALFVTIAQRYNVKKIACALSIPIIFFYVALSGFAYPALRSFYMTTFVFIAIICDRFPLSIRSVMIAAFLILLCFPESAISISFQLSFSAVIGLIAFYECSWHRFIVLTSDATILKKSMIYFLGISLTTVIATLSTTPISLYYFHQFSCNAMFANIVAIPLTAFFIMPFALLTVLSYFIYPIDVIYHCLDFFIQILISIAAHVSSWKGSKIPIPQPSVLYIILFSFGFLWLCLFKTKLRFLGGIFILMSFFTFLDKSHLPDIYIAGNGSSMAYVKDDALYVSDKKGKFYYDQWQQERGHLRIKYWDDNIANFHNILFVSNPWTFDRGFFKTFDCPEVLLTNGYVYKCRSASKIIIERSKIKENGGHFIWLNPFKVVTSKEFIGNRPWS